MKIHLYNNDGTKQVVEIPTSSEDLPEILYQFVENRYRFYRKGSARNSTTFYETVALHVPETAAAEEKI